MIVRDAKAALLKSGSATLSQIAAELGQSKAMVAAALDYWVSRGQARILRVGEAPEFAPATCSPVSCSHCPLVPLCTGRGGTDRAEQPAAIYVWDEGGRDGADN